jgi:hypothetical protein
VQASHELADEHDEVKRGEDERKRAPERPARQRKRDVKNDRERAPDRERRSLAVRGTEAARTTPTKRK